MKRLPDEKYTFKITQPSLVIKRVWRSHIHKLICFQSLGIKSHMIRVKFSQGQERKPSGKEANPAEEVYGGL